MLKTTKPRTQRKGFLALIGGGEDKVHGKDVLRQVAMLNSAARAVIIPTASSYGMDLGAEYAGIFRDFGIAQCDVLDIRYADHASDPAYVQKVDDADLIFFTGGDQVRLVEILNHSPVLAQVRARLVSGATVAGTSAGAAAASNPMMYGGDGHGFDKEAVRVAEGFGFIDGITFDTHFVSRGRIPRLTQFLCSGRSQYGLGLAEDTGVIITPDDVATVIGSDMVTALSTAALEYSNYHEVESEQHFTAHGVQLSFLAAGTRFDLRSWTCADIGCDLSKPVFANRQEVLSKFQ